MLRRLSFVFLLTCFLLPSFSVLAARLPSAKTAQTVTRKFLDKYGQKYPATVFGQHNLSQVQINSIQEISYHIVYVDTALTFKNGKYGRALVKLNNKFPKGWRVISWELAQN